MPPIFSLVNRKKLLYAQCNVNAAKDIKKARNIKYSARYIAWVAYQLWNASPS